MLRRLSELGRIERTLFTLEWLQNVNCAGGAKLRATRSPILEVARYDRGPGSRLLDSMGPQFVLPGMVLCQ
jgi:hypothetical protein